MRLPCTAGAAPAETVPSLPSPAGGSLFSGRRRWRSVLVVPFLLLVCPAHAALTSSALTGRVIAGDDAPLAGVTVTATSPALQHPRTTVTGSRGTYWLAALPAGEYAVTFSRAGMTTFTRRAIVELGRVARADARLEVSADEESVTSTATQKSVADTTAVTTHFDDATLDRFPSRAYAAVVSPDAYAPYTLDVDGAPPYLSPAAIPEDATEQVTLFRAATPVEYESYGGRAYAVRTRSGREDFFLSLRDTVSDSSWNEGGPFAGRDDGLQNSFEANGGGRIVSRRLWFFAAFWAGTDATRYTRDERGMLLKLHAQLGAANHLDANYARADASSSLSTESSNLSLRHTGAFGAHLTTETIVSRASSSLFFPNVPAGPPPPREHVDFVSSRASYVVGTGHGDHVLTGGVTAWDARHFDTHSLFVSDRWSSSRWVVNAGLRYENTSSGEQLSPRLAVTYDLRGDGTRAIAASFGESSFGTASAPTIRVAALGYAASIGSSGSARIDFIKRDGPSGTATSSLQLDTRYRLFDRFEAGATYTYTRLDDSDAFLSGPRQLANAWIGAQLPVGAHEIGVTLLQRYLELQGYNTGNGAQSRSATPTDLALRYSIPLSRAGLMFAADLTNAFGSNDDVIPRTLRFWTRLRL